MGAAGGTEVARPGVAWADAPAHELNSIPGMAEATAAPAAE
jgi:hypothetical protein